MADPAVLRYLSRADVVAAASEIDPVGVVEQALLLHGQGATTLPEEAYLSWTTPQGHFARSLGLPGALWGERPAIGLKVINSSLGNVAAGLPRADGLTLMFDPETAHPTVVMQAAFLSAWRTSAYTALSVRLLAPPDVVQVAVIGCGVLGAEHVRLLRTRLPDARFTVHDQAPERRDRMIAELSADGGRIEPATQGMESLVRGSQVVITTTTTTTGYIPLTWLSPGALVAHVSLDDVLPDVVRGCDVLVVDDWSLIEADDRRLLGRLIRAGELRGPADTDHQDGQVATPGARRVDASLADVIAGRHPGRSTRDQIILSNPFGMGVLDVALADVVVQAAERRGLGTLLAK